MLEQSAMDRGIAALKRMRAIADIHNAKLRAVATSAVREAQNQNEFIKRARKEADVEVEIISGIEDKELTLMEEADSLAPEIAAADKVHADEKARMEGQIGLLREKEGNLKKRIEEVQQSRATALEGIDEELLERYERLFETKNARAVVSVEHDVCTGCHMKITAQTSLALRSEKSVISCPQCGRLLHLPA